MKVVGARRCLALFLFLFAGFHQCLYQRLHFVRIPFSVAYGRTNHIAFGVDEEFHGCGVGSVQCAYLACLVDQIHICKAVVSDITFNKGFFLSKVNTQNSKWFVLEMLVQILEGR